ncbi:MAG: glycosyltransferase family 39 protein [Elusimicrobiota bacterium]|nr:glycosyltransferase family 39 protein [Elusimicrobiota bacterium]
MRRSRLAAVPSDILAAAGLVSISLLAFWPALTYGFLNYDDDLYVTGNAAVQGGLSLSGTVWAFTTIHASNWYPLTLLSHMLDVSLFGTSPAGHHLVSVVLHASSVLLLFFALRRMTGDAARSAAAAALFAVHPLQAESVAWIAERKNVLCGFFCLAAVNFYARYAESRSRRAYWAVTAAFGAALLSKPAAVPLPLAFLLLDRWPLRRPDPWTDLAREKLPWAALAAASCAVTLAAASGRSIVELPAAVRLANAALSYAAYLRQFVWPSGLAAFYPHPGLAIGWLKAGAAAAALAALALGALRARRSRPHLAVGFFWFLVFLLPSIGLVQVGQQAMADRYAYLALIGLALAAAWTLPPPATAAFAVVMLLACVRQVGYWSDTLTLFRRAVDAGGGSVVAHVNLCYELFTAGRDAEGEAECRAALAIDPDDYQALNNLGRALTLQGRRAEARVLLERALRSSPGNPAILFNLTLTEPGEGRAPKERVP